MSLKAGSLEVELLARLDRLSSDMSRGQRVVEAATTRMQEQADRAAASIRSVGLAAAGGFSAQGLVRLADQYTGLQARIGLVTDSERERISVQQQLTAVSERQLAPLGEVVSLYVKGSDAAAELGADQQALMTFTEGVAAALRLQAGPTQTAQGALLQLGQAIGGVKVQAEEYNSILDGARPLLQAVADNLDGAGGSVARLTAMVKAGEVSSRAFFEAAVAGSQQLIDKAGQIPATVGQALQLAQDRLMAYVGAGNQATGITAALVQTIDTLSGQLDVLGAVVAGGAVALLGRQMAALAISTAGSTRAALQEISARQAARAATLAETAAKVQALQASEAAIAAGRAEQVAALGRANAQLQAAQAQVAAARSAGALSFALAALRQGEAAALAATQARSAALAELALLSQHAAKVQAGLAAATTAQAAAQASASTSAMLAGRALALLGGPVGAITTALGLGVTAWLMWGNTADKTSAQAAESMEERGARIRKALDEEIARLEKRNALAAAGTPVQRQGSDEQQDYLQSLLDRAAKLAARSRQVGSSQAALDAVEIQRLHREYATLATKIRLASDAKDRLQAGSVADVRSAVLKGYQTDAERLASALEDARAQFAKIGQALPQDVEDRIRASFGSKAAREAEGELQALRDTLLQTAGVSADFYKAWDRLSTLYRRGSIDAETLRREQAKLLAQQPGVQAGLQDEAAAREAAADAARRQIQISAAYVQAEQDSLQAVTAQVEAQRSANEEIGLTAEALRELELRRLQDAEAQALQLLQQRLGEQAAVEEIDTITQRIEALRELIKLRRQGFAKQAQADAADEARKATAEIVKEYDRAAQAIERSITDALMRGFEGGKGFGRNLVNTLAATLKSQFGNAIIGPIARTLSQAINQALGSVRAPGTSGAAVAPGVAAPGSALETLGVISNLKSAYSTLTDGINSASSSLSFFASDVGDWLVMNTTGPLNSIGGSLMENAAAIGDVAPYLGSILSALQGDIKGAALSAAGTYLGTAFGGPLGGVLGGIAGNLLSGLMGSSDPYHSGSAYAVTAEGVGSRPMDRAWYRENAVTQSSVGFKDFTKRRSAELDEALKSFTVGASATMNGILGAFGKESVALSTWFRANGEKASGSFIAGGQSQAAWKTGTNDVGQAFGEFAGYVSGEIVQSLIDAGLPDWAESILQAIDQSKGVAALQEAAQSIGLILQVTERLSSLPIANLAGVTAETVIALGQLAGGLEGLQGGLQAYYTAFYSEEERAAAARSALGEQLASLADTTGGTLAAGLDDLAATLMGVEGATSISRSEFRALLESIDPNNEATRQLYVQLLGLAPAFAEAVPEVESLVDETGGLADAAARAAEVLRQRQGLERELLQLSGDEAALRALERAEIDASNLALFDRVSALRASQQAERSMASALDRVATLRESAADRVAAAEARVAELQQAAADRLRSVAGSLLDFVAEAQAADQAAASPAALRDRLQQQAAAARAGDTQAQAGLAATARSLLDAEAQRATSAAQLAVERARITSLVESVALDLQSQADAQAPAPAATDATRLAGAQAELAARQAELLTVQGLLDQQGIDLAGRQLTELQQLNAALQDYAAASLVAAQSAISLASGQPMPSLTAPSPAAASAALPTPATLGLAPAAATGQSEAQAALGTAAAATAEVARLKQEMQAVAVALKSMTSNLQDIRNVIYRDAFDGTALLVRTAT